MTSADDQEEQRRRRVADSVLYWMRRRGLTRQVFADRLGKSVSWVDKIKNGDRQLDRLSVLRQIAHVLDIPLQTLVDPDEADRLRRCPDDGDIAAIRSALRRYDAITNVFRSSDDVLPEPNLRRLERSVRYGWMAFQVSNYQAIGQLLPALIHEAQAAVRQLADDDQRTARACLAWTYQLTAATAFKLGDAQLGWIAADRGIQLAEQTGDLTLVASAARWVAHALIDTFRSGDAVTMVRSAADRLAPHLERADTAFMSAYGMLLLKGSIAAARLYQATDVRDLQAEALSVANVLGAGPNVLWSSFGPTNVRVHEVSALADMQSGGRVTEAAAGISQVALMSLPKERPARRRPRPSTGWQARRRRVESARRRPVRSRRGPLPSDDPPAHRRPGGQLPARHPAVLRPGRPGTSGRGHGMTPRRVLYVITCATLAARDVGKLVTLAQDARWTVCVIATPMSTRFIDQDALTAQTGHPVRSDYKQPGTSDVLPQADAMIIGGASANTINKLAAGISDNVALGVLNEAIGLGLPLVILPFVNTALAAHPAFDRSVRELRAAGVAVLLGDEAFVPNPPGEGEKALSNFPWQAALQAVEELQNTP